MEFVSFQLPRVKLLFLFMYYTIYYIITSVLGLIICYSHYRLFIWYPPDNFWHQIDSLCKTCTCLVVQFVCSSGWTSQFSLWWALQWANISKTYNILPKSGWFWKSKGDGIMVVGRNIPSLLFISKMNAGRHITGHCFCHIQHNLNGKNGPNHLLIIISIVL